MFTLHIFDHLMNDKLYYNMALYSESNLLYIKRKFKQLQCYDLRKIDFSNIHFLREVRHRNKRLYVLQFFLLFL